MRKTGNLHSHGKIWLSADPNVFMPALNQLRLVQMRAINPRDEIRLFYDANLLSLKALEDLSKFCFRQKIIPLNVRETIFPFCTTKEELKLIECYMDEVDHLTEHGNLGAASDILRFLRPLYSLFGIYSDLDVIINTKFLPFEKIKIETPFILPVKFFSEPAFLTTRKTTSLCNDILVMSSEQEETDPFILKIQQRIIDSCTRDGKINPYMFKHIAKEPFMENLSLKRPGRTARELRALFINMTAKENNCTINQKNNAIFYITSEIVMCTTGPRMLTQQFYNQFGDLDYSHMKYFSISHYDELKPIDSLSQLATGQSDISFTQHGVQDIKAKEINLSTAATKIQRFFKLPDRHQWKVSNHFKVKKRTLKFPAEDGKDKQETKKSLSCCIS